MSDAVSGLARSRQAISEQFAQALQPPAPGEPARWFARLGAAASTWWHCHPAHLGLATTRVSKYARRSPWRFLAAAAAAGVLITTVHGWRALSVSLPVAVVKSSRLSGLLLSALAALAVA